MYYTAIEMQKKLEEKYPNQITVRQIRTYSQQEMISPPIRVDGKLKYEEKHLNELETIINLRLKGKKNEEIKGVLSNYNAEYASNALRSESQFYETENMFKYKTEQIFDGLRIQYDEDKINEDFKDLIVLEIQNILNKKGEM